MNTVDICFKKIYEHDIDLLIMEEFISSKAFASIFLRKVGLDDSYTVHRVLHSLSDADGESDITIILQYPTDKVALLIEDKIDAPTMHEQSQRYLKRAASGRARGDYDRAYIILAAPESYHVEHADDKNADYAYRICYEEILEYFHRQNTPRANYKAAMIEFALAEKKAGYIVQENRAVSEFWRSMRAFCKANYPHLYMLGSDTPKGASAAWPEFSTSLKNVKVIYKSQKGAVDLEFPGYGKRTADLRSVIDQPVNIRPTGKSAVVRIAKDRWIADFSHPFEEYTNVLAEVLQAVSDLCQLAAGLNYSDLY